VLQALFCALLPEKRVALHWQKCWQRTRLPTLGFEHLEPRLIASLAHLRSWQPAMADEKELERLSKELDASLHRISNLQQGRTSVSASRRLGRWVRSPAALGAVAAGCLFTVALARLEEKREHTVRRPLVTLKYRTVLLRAYVCLWVCRPSARQWTRRGKRCSKRCRGEQSCWSVFLRTVDGCRVCLSASHSWRRLEAVAAVLLVAACCASRILHTSTRKRRARKLPTRPLECRVRGEADARVARLRSCIEAELAGPSRGLADRLRRALAAADWGPAAGAPAPAVAPAVRIPAVEV